MQDLKEKIYKTLKRKIAPSCNFLVDFPDKNITSAHFYTNLAFVLGKIKKENPQEEAKVIEQKLKNLKMFSFLETQNGFINFWVSDDYLKKELKKILILKEKYWRGKKKKGKIQLEYISANPTGPLTLANGRGGFFGDVLSRLLQIQGWEVEREYYVNDTGNQVATLGKSILAHLGVIPWEDDFYRGDYVKEWAIKNVDYIKKHQDNPLLIGEKAALYFLKNIQNVLEKKANIKFDRYTSEKSLHKKGLVRDVLNVLKKSGFVFEKDEALWLKTTSFGDDKDRVLLTKEKKPTYFLADAGHYLETKKRGFKNKINILGPDHYGYVKRIQAVANILGFKKSEVLITQAVLIKKGGEFVRMSKRKGQFVTFEELIDEVGEETARFLFLTQALNSHIDFDIELAKEKSQKNPLFYIEYSYVRAKNILKKSHKKSDLKSFYGFSENEKNLVFEIVKFPSVLKLAAENYEIHKLLKYGIDLARVFHTFYEKERVLGDKKEEQKLAIILGFTFVLEEMFKILNIKLPQMM